MYTRPTTRLPPIALALIAGPAAAQQATTTSASDSNPGGEKGPVNEARVAAVLVDLVE